MNLEPWIQAWREQLEAMGSISPEALNELEVSLRDSVDALIRRGWAPKAAFEEARRRLGDAESLAAEFAKLDERAFVRARMGWMIAGSTILALWIAVAGAASQAARNFEFWFKFHVPVKDANPMDAVEFLNHPSVIGKVTRLGTLVLFGLGLRYWSSRPAVRRGFAKLQSNAWTQSALLGLGAWVPFVLFWLTSPVAIRFPNAPVGYIPHARPLTISDYASAFGTPLAIVLLAVVFAWSLNIEARQSHGGLIRKVQQVAQRHIIAWMGLGCLVVTLLALFVWWVGRVAWELAAGAFNVSGVMVVFDPGAIYAGLATGTLCIMSGAAFLGIRLLECMILRINRSFFLRLAHSGWIWLALSVLGVLALRAIIFFFEGWNLTSYLYRWGGLGHETFHHVSYRAVFLRVPIVLTVVAAMIALRFALRRGAVPAPLVVRRVEE